MSTTLQHRFGSNARLDLSEANNPKLVVEYLDFRPLGWNNITPELAANADLWLGAMLIKSLNFERSTIPSPERLKSNPSLKPTVDHMITVEADLSQGAGLIKRDGIYVKPYTFNVTVFTADRAPLTFDIDNIK